MEWLAVQVWRPSTEAQVRSFLKNHILPTFGERQLSAIKTSHPRAWVKDRSHHLAPPTLKVVHGYLSTILKSPA